MGHRPRSLVNRLLGTPPDGEQGACNFENFSGAIVVAEDGTPSVTAEIAVASINTGNEQRDAHIKSADFFEVEKYPTATFTSTGVRANGDDYVRHQAGQPRARVQRCQPGHGPG